MRTEILVVDPENPDPEIIAHAATVLRDGRLVAFPTETVYGLGANGLDPRAVRGIFEAKRRPATNPLILHVADAAAARGLASHWPASAAALAAKFWPGPLTLVLPKGDHVPGEVTAGGPTVAARTPRHAVALALLRAVGLPLAAPSANQSTSLSPTRAEHVRRQLEGAVDLILDGGPTPGGLESTVLDLTESPPRVLRPGLISPAELDAALGQAVRRPATPEEDEGREAGPSRGAARSPGQTRRHYAPWTPVLWLEPGDWRTAYLLGEEHGRVTCLALDAPNRLEVPGVEIRWMPTDPAEYAARLYDTLYAVDQQRPAYILVMPPPDTEEWLAVRDRLRRAASR